MAAATAAVFVVAVLVHLLPAMQYGDDPFRERLVSDALSYHRWALRIVEHGLADEPVFHQAPAFPVLLAAVYAAVPEPGRATAALAVQVLLNAAALALLVPLGARFLGSVRAGVLGAALAGLHGPFAFYALKLLAVPLALATQGAAWAALGRARERRGVLAAGAAGAALGLAALARTEMLLALPVFAAALLTTSSHRRKAAAATCVLGCALAVAPATVHNLRRGDRVVVASSGGENLFIGNQRGARGAYSPIHPRAGDLFSERALARALAEEHAGRRLRPSEVSRHWRSAALAEIAADPAGWLRLEVVKLGRILHPGDPNDAYSYPLERARYLGSLHLLPLPGWTLLLAGGAGVILALRSRPRSSWPLVAAVGVQTLTLLAFFVNTRLRLPLLYALAPFGGLALDRAVDAWRAGARRAPLALAAGLVVATALGMAWTRPSARDHVRLASVLSTEGRLDEALAALEPALAVEPPDGLALDQAGWLHQRRGDLDAARELYERALRAELPATRRVQTRTRLAMVLEGLGRLDESLAQHDLACASDLATAGTFHERGMFLLRRGRIEDARRDLREAVRLDPGWPPPRLALERLNAP